jgi:hypothetical protein
MLASTYFKLLLAHPSLLIFLFYRFHAPYLFFFSSHSPMPNLTFCAENFGSFASPTLYAPHTLMWVLCVKPLQFHQSPLYPHTFTSKKYKESNQRFHYVIISFLFSYTPPIAIAIESCNKISIIFILFFNCIFKN